MIIFGTNCLSCEDARTGGKSNVTWSMHTHVIDAHTPVTLIRVLACDCTHAFLAVRTLGRHHATYILYIIKYLIVGIGSKSYGFRKI